MTSIDSIERISNTSLILESLKYCLVDSNKLPFKIDGSIASPNNIGDFCDFDELLSCEKLNEFRGIGISVQASGIWALDLDHCFSTPNLISSSTSKIVKELLDLFKDTYSEFSFSGTGLRILFKCNEYVKNYKNYFYIKNEKLKLECYQPCESFRYVTLTGNSINNLPIKEYDFNFVMKFLEIYMKRPSKMEKSVEIKEETRTLDQLLSINRKFYLTNMFYQELWFSNAPGSGSDESQRDFKILCLIFENVTTDKERIREIFETSPYFKSKDRKHKYKWEYQDHRYYDYVYSGIVSSH